MTPFTENAGRFLDSKETEEMKGTYRDRKLSIGLTDDDYVRSEYFGINQIRQLLDKPGCIGLRIHQAKRWEDADGNPTAHGKGQLKPRVLLTGVDQDGNDMSVWADTAVRADISGLKDMAAGGGGGSLGEGMPCPQMCQR